MKFVFDRQYDENERIPDVFQDPYCTLSSELILVSPKNRYTGYIDDTFEF